MTLTRPLKSLLQHTAFIQLSRRDATEIDGANASVDRGKQARDGIVAPLPLPERTRLADAGHVPFRISVQVYPQHLGHVGLPVQAEYAAHGATRPGACYSCNLQQRVLERGAIAPDKGGGHPRKIREQCA